jgi:uracil-DNA glycosylase family 4
MKGANRTGRPFTGDYAGDLLYSTLLETGFASGRYGADPSDGLKLSDCRITNAVRCVPPQNKPTPAEIATCLDFLRATVAGMSRLTAILALGRIAHDATVRAFDQRLAAHRFAHGAQHTLRPGLVLFDSYHSSRYNKNTGVLTEAMFRAVLLDVRRHLDRD